MSRSADANRINQAFLDAVGKLGLSVVTMDKIAAESENDAVRRTFQRLGQADREVYFVRGVGIINLHVRSEPPGWWNVLKTVKDDLDWLRRELKIGCYYVLLVGRRDHFVADGYIAAEFAYPPFKRPPGVEATKYSINERQHLDRSKVFLSVEEVAAALASYRKPKEKESTGEPSAL
jgi:hypothetical protein